MRELEQWVIKKDNFPKAFRESAPSFRELHIDLGGFQAFIDQVYDINGSVMICDLKTSTLSTGRVPGTDRYIPAGITGVSDEYVLQLFIYAWAYWKQYNVMADWLSLKYVKYGYEFTIPFKFMDREKIFTAIEELLDAFTQATESKDINDFPMNDNGKASQFKEWNIHNTFCSAKTTKFSGRGFCFYDRFCNNELEDIEPEEESSCIIELDDKTIEIPGWLASKKGLSDSKYQGVIVRTSEKALLLKVVGFSDEIWVPKSQIS